MEVPITMTFGELEDMLRPLFQQHLQEQAADPSTMEQEVDMGPAFDNLHKLIENHARSTQGLEVSGIPLPDVDEQLGPLQREVDAVLQRLAGAAGLRKTVPAMMASALEQQLKALRPPEDTQGAADQQAGGTADADPQQLDVEAARNLHQAMKDALNKWLGLRARLEEMEMRLGRNLAAVGAVQASADKPPATVERVLRGVAAGRGMGAGAAGGGGDDAEGEVVAGTQ